ncbi:MAG: hypothetical protein QOC74_4142 [Pseudonocardiales bacterium]|nr:hypothetical protein [Pseudonocardiales bacterium]
MPSSQRTNRLDSAPIRAVAVIRSSSAAVTCAPTGAAASCTLISSPNMGIRPTACALSAASVIGASRSTRPLRGSPVSNPTKASTALRATASGATGPGAASATAAPTATAIASRNCSATCW